MARDMTVTQEFNNLPDAKVHFARLVEYIEVGEHTSEYKGVPTDPKEQIVLGFDLLSPSDIFEHEGKKCTRVFRTYPINVGYTSRSKCKKIFTAMNYDGKAKSFADLIDKPILLPIKHVTSATGKERAEIDIDKLDCAPVHIDPATDVSTTYDIPERINDTLVFDLMDENVDLADWDKLFIGGTREDGSSKNFRQEQIMSALNFPGSPLDTKLKALQGDTTEAPAVVPVQEAPVAATPAPVAPETTAEAPEAPTVAPTTPEAIQDAQAAALAALD